MSRYLIALFGGLLMFVVGFLIGIFDPNNTIITVVVGFAWATLSNIVFKHE